MYQKQFLQLLQSPNKDNVEIAIQISNTLPQINLDKYLQDYTILHYLCFGTRLTRPLQAQDIAKINQTDTVNLLNTNLETLPRQIHTLTLLTNINLSCNKITKLPSSLARIENLSIINLGGNNLKSIPSEIGNLKKLHSLLVAENQITSLPESIGLANDLTLLDLQRNKITSLPNTISNLVNLRELHLRKNPISESEIRRIKSQLPRCKIYF